MESRIQLCGALVARIEGHDLAPALPAAQGRLLFAYLVVNRTRPSSREELADFLWGDEPPAAPAQAVRVLLSKLRTAVGPDRIADAAGPRLRLPSDVWIDLEAASTAIHEAESAVRRGEFERAWYASHIALNVARRRFLAGHEHPWIEERRIGLEGIRVRAYETLAAAGLELGGPELDTAERAARALTDASPFHETGWVLLMRTLAAKGNAAEALFAYERLRCLLRDELGTAPGAELQRLHATLLA